MRSAIRVFAIFVVLLCQAKPAPGAEYPISGPRDRIAVSYSAVSPTFGVLWLAKEAGLFERNGLDAQLIYIQSSPTNIQALLNNDIQIAVAGSSGVINSAAGGLDLIFIGALFEGMAYHLITDKSIKSPADLKGKRIGVSRFGSSSHYAIEAALEKLGLDPKKDVTVLQIGSENVRAAAITKGGIQATVISPPLHPAHRKLGLQTLVSLNELKIAYLSDAIIVRRAYYNANPRPVRRFLRALVEAYAHYRKPENRPQVARALAKYQGLDPQTDRETLDETIDLFSKEFYGRTPRVARDALEAVVKGIGQRNPEVLKLDIDKIIDNTYLAELEKSGFVASLYK
jgi:ABC-type nitrate/sulfonate/bicarbonate transport system substrate-binding protein